MEEKDIDSKCPNCGSRLVYDTETKSLKCVSCSSIFDIESLGTGDLDEEERDYYQMLKELRESTLDKTIVSSLNCENCGASLMNDSTSASIVCPFCGSSHIVQKNIEEEVIPISGVIPFATNDEECNLKFHKWIKGKWFAPNQFKKAKYALDLYSVYLPFWTFDMNCYTKYRARRGDYEYITVRKRNSDGEWVNKRERITHWSFRRGSCNNSFDDIMVLGSNQTNRHYINKVCNFDFNKMEKFKPEFLIGYHGEKISLPLEQGFERAKEIIKPRIEDTIEHDVGGDECRIISYNTEYSNITFKQILVPIYNGLYSYKGKKYNFVVNGQTSKFAGSYPVSAIKVFFFVFGMLILIAAIVLLVMSVS